MWGRERCECVKGFFIVLLDIDYEEIIVDYLMMLFFIVNKILKYLNVFINYFFFLIVYDRYG